jgi:hypothetical protein
MHVPSDVPRVTFFTKIPKCSWNRIVGVNPLPRGASIGEFRKIRHPRNIEFNEVLEICFQDKAFAIFRNLGPAKPRSREHAIFRNLVPAKPRSRGHAIFGNLESAKPRSHEHAKVWNLESAKSRTSEDGKFGSLSEVWFGSRERGNSRTSEKQSQSCRPKKSGFGV